MGINKEGYQKRVATLIKKYGGLQEYKERVREWAIKGGQQSTGGFHRMTEAQRREAGRLGGSVPRVKKEAQNGKRKRDKGGV